MKKFLILIFAGLLFLLPAIRAQQSNVESKIDEIISKMTLEEKIDFIGGQDQFNIRAYPQLGIPLVRMADGPVGVRNYPPSTAFTASIALAASWDTTLAASVGRAIGMEARSKNVNIMLGPGMNIYRAPMNGRNFEYLGEDPYLAGKIAANYVTGMQSEGVMATAKHYMANFMEYDRHNVSSDMDERTMQEIYLPAFKMCVTQGKVAAVMTSYNLVNGLHASQNGNIIDTILKRDWKFPGFVMSDWGSVYNGVAVANAGLDIEMPAGEHMCEDTLLPAIKAGIVSEKTIDDKVRRILREEFRFGLFDHPDISLNYKPDTAWVRKTSIDEEREGIVLLKNENNVLPIDMSKVHSIAVMGPNAYPAVTGGGGSSQVQPRRTISLLESIKKLAGDKIKINYDAGDYGQQKMPDEFYNNAGFYTYFDSTKVCGMNAAFYSSRRPEGKPDYETFYLNVNKVFNDSMPGISKNMFFARFSGFLKVDVSGNYRFVVSSSKGFRLMIDGKQVMGTWRSEGEVTHSAMVPLEAGKEYKVELNYFQRGPGGVIRLGYEAPSEYEQKMAEALKKTIAIADQSDLVILSLGFNNETEHEGADRSFSLPEEQLKLLQTLTNKGKDVVVVINAGGNVDMNGWLDKVKGLVYAWYPGAEGNIAVAEVLFGKINPSGKLPATFEKRWEDNATYNSYYDKDGDKHVKFTEGIFLGYRHFDKENITPQFPFGFGLSYTTFGYNNLKLGKPKISAKNGVSVPVSLTLTNTGKYDGAEVVQLYVADPVSSLPRPVKELKAFSRVYLKAGESKEVRFNLTADAFQYFNPDKKGWVLEPGEFDILIGNSSRDIRLQNKLTIK